MKIVDETVKEAAMKYKDLATADVFLFEGGDRIPRMRSLYGYMNLVTGEHVRTDSKGIINSRDVLLLDATLTFKEK